MRKLKNYSFSPVYWIFWGLRTRTHFRNVRIRICNKSTYLDPYLLVYSLASTRLKFFTHMKIGSEPDPHGAWICIFNQFVELRNIGVQDSVVEQLMGQIRNMEDTISSVLVALEYGPDMGTIYRLNQGCIYCI